MIGMLFYMYVIPISKTAYLSAIILHKYVVLYCIVLYVINCSKRIVTQLYEYVSKINKCKDILNTKYKKHKFPLQGLPSGLLD